MRSFAGYKKQFLEYARKSGVFVGRSVGFIRQKRDQVFTSSKQKAEMDALQNQLSDAMSQLQFIRHDIRSSIRDPKYDRTAHLPPTFSTCVLE
jgi:hypothetical protein